MMVAHNGWSEWQNHVLAELKRLNTNLENFEEKNESDHRNIFTTLAALKVKAGIWGAAAGLIPGVIALIWIVLQQFGG
jgi:hypothetical protein